MSCEFGQTVKISIFGQSHSPAIGVVMDGLPAGHLLDLDQIWRFLARRAPGKAPYATARKEADMPEILSGLTADGYTCGAPLCALIRNTDTRSKDYSQLKDLPRPSHADFTAFVKYGRHHDIRGGGNFSGRLTAPLCFAGAVAMQLLEKQGVFVGAHIAAIGGVADTLFDPVGLTRQQLLTPGSKEFPVIDEEAGQRMKEQIEQARQQQDSLGGLVECGAIGVPAGLGEPMFDGLENRLAAALFAIPAVRGVEFGAGFAAASMAGSQHNDPFALDEQGAIVCQTNNHGGILGGISSGMPILLRCAFKPTPSIARPQQTVSLSRRETCTLAIQGRHDPCIVPRAVPCVEAATALVLLDFALKTPLGKPSEKQTDQR